MRPGRESGWVEHAPFAFWLVDAMRPKVFVELGAYTGYSYFAVCQAVKASSLDTRCYAIDTWKGDEHAGFYDEGIYNDVQQYNDAHYSGFSRLVRSTFDEAVAHFDDASIELLHIDGRHYYEDVLSDFETWLPKMTPHGIVIFHDINVRERNFGVYKLWAKLKKQYASFEFIHGHGLGIICVGKNPPPALSSLFAAAADEEASGAVRMAYARLGRGISDGYALVAGQVEAAAEFEAIRHQLTERDAALEVLRARIGQLDELQAERDADNRTIASLRAECDEFVRRIEASEQQLQATRAELASAAERIGVLAAAASDDQRRIGYLHAVTSRSTRELAEARDRTAQLTADLAAAAEERSRLQAALSAREIEVNALQAELQHRSVEVQSLTSFASGIRQAFESSTSWRLTAPLRAFKVRLRAKRGESSRNGQ